MSDGGAMLQPMSATAWAAVGTWVTAAIYVAILIYAIKQVGEAKSLRRAQTRPFVVVDIEPGWALYLKIENIGATLARNVRFSFDPRLASSMQKPWEIEEAPLLRDGVDTFPPRKHYRIFFDAFQDRAGRDDLPMVYTATVTYEDSDGHGYVDHYTLDLNSILHTSPEQPGLEKVGQELERMRKYFDRWTDGVRGLLVHARDRDEMQRQERELLEERRRAREAAPPEPGEGG